MPNEIKLQEGHPVDENLRPIKVGGKSTAIETAQHGNGAKVNGDLGVTDDINCDNLSMTGTLTSSNLTIDDSGDITLAPSSDGAGSGTILLTHEGNDGGAIFVSSSVTKLMGVATNNTIELESKGTGDIELDSNGDITLDSHAGNFIMSKGDTEFSAANSAYAGMILGYTAIGIDATHTNVSVAGTFAVTDADHKVTFVAPPSGKVEIFVSISAQATTQRWLQFGLSDNATYAAIDFPNADDVTNEHNIIDLSADGFPRILTNNWVVEGLTAGTSYTWWLGAETEQAGRMTLYWGSNTSGRYPPFIMKATALPATIYTG